MRTTDKVIMTMVTLTGNPVKSTQPCHSKTLPNTYQMLPEPIVSNMTLQRNETHTFSPTAGLCDIPTYVTMTAAMPDADDDDDDDCHQPHPSLSPSNIPAITPAFHQQWEEFYNKFLHFDHPFGALTLITNDSKHASLPTAPNTEDNDFHANDDPDSIEAFLSELDILRKELRQLHRPFNNSPSCTSTTVDATIHDGCTCNHYPNTEHDKHNIDDNNRDNNDLENGDSTTAGRHNDYYDTNK